MYNLTPPQRKTSANKSLRRNYAAFLLSRRFLCLQFKVAASLFWKMSRRIPHHSTRLRVVMKTVEDKKPLTLCSMAGVIAAWTEENQYSAFISSWPSVKWTATVLRPARHQEEGQGNFKWEKWLKQNKQQVIPCRKASLLVCWEAQTSYNTIVCSSVLCWS